MEKFLNFLKDPNGDLSSKRLIGFVGAANTIGYCWIFTAVGKMDPSVAVYAFMGMVLGGIFGATVDHWSK